MRKAIAIGMVLALITMVFAAVPMKVSAPQVRGFAPKRGKSGGKINIIGKDLDELGTPKITFGSKEAVVTPVNPQLIRAEVPSLSVLDPNPVEVTITFDGEPPLGGLWFLYDPPGPEPIIKDFKPPMGLAWIPFSLELTGTSFMTPPGRVPNQIFLISPTDVIEGTVVAGSATDTSFIAEFPPAPAGDFEILVGFSDDSGASISGFKIT